MDDRSALGFLTFIFALVMVSRKCFKSIWLTLSAIKCECNDPNKSQQKKWHKFDIFSLYLASLGKL